MRMRPEPEYDYVTRLFPATDVAATNLIRFCISLGRRLHRENLDDYGL